MTKCNLKCDCDAFLGDKLLVLSPPAPYAKSEVDYTNKHILCPGCGKLRGFSLLFHRSMWRELTGQNEAN